MKKIVILKLIVLVLLSACETKSNKNSYKNVKEDIYEIVCKHPMGHIRRMHLVKSEWEHATDYRNSVWRFTDVNNIEVKTHGPCYTDSTMIVTGEE